MTTIQHALRTLLDRLYLVCGVLAALFLIVILLLIVLQMLARWTGEVFPGASDYASYCMAAASFFAFAHALNRGAHIRVNLLFNLLGERGRRAMNIWCFAIGSGLAWYFTYFAVMAVYWSWKFNDISQGQDATPIWIPQLSMIIGAAVFAIALSDHLLHLVFAGHHRMRAETVNQEV